MSCLGRIARRILLVTITVLAFIALIRWALGDVASAARPWICTHDLLATNLICRDHA